MVEISTVWNVIAQVCIIIFSGAAIWLVGRKDKWKRYGYIAGLLSQPFYLWATWTMKQWGMFIMSIWYTFAWGYGFYNYWFRDGNAASLFHTFCPLVKSVMWRRNR